MNKRQTFEDIIKLMTHDYAGCEDIQVDANEYLQQLDENMDNNAFYNLVEDYLRDFNDEHVWLTANDSILNSLGFKVRRDGDSLFVTEVIDEKNLKLGDEIVGLDDLSIAEIANEHKVRLDSIVDRQNWDWLIKRATNLKLANGKIVPIKRYGREYISKFIFEQLNDATGYMQITDFNNPKKINGLINEHKNELSQFDYLIIDVRTNYGNEQTAYWQLLDYFVDQPEKLVSHYPEHFGYKIWWTERNKINWLAELESVQKERPTLAMREMYQESYRQWENKHTATQKNAFENSIEQHSILPEGRFKRVFVLSDWYSGSAAEDFVMLAKTFPKVTVVGRNTRGTTDYEDVAAQRYDKFRVWYPTTRSKLIDFGMATNGVGVKPDVVIPWTHDSIKQDADVEWVLDEIMHNH